MIKTFVWIKSEIISDIDFLSNILMIRNSTTYWIEVFEFLAYFFTITIARVKNRTSHIKEARHCQ